MVAVRPARALTSGSWIRQSPDDSVGSSPSSGWNRPCSPGSSPGGHGVGGRPARGQPPASRHAAAGTRAGRGGSRPSRAVPRWARWRAGGNSRASGGVSNRTGSRPCPAGATQGVPSGGYSESALAVRTGCPPLPPTVEGTGCPGDYTGDTRDSVWEMRCFRWDDHRAYLGRYICKGLAPLPGIPCISREAPAHPRILPVFAMYSPREGTPPWEAPRRKLKNIPGYEV